MAIRSTGPGLQLPRTGTAQDEEPAPIGVDPFLAWIATYSFGGLDE